MANLPARLDDAMLARLETYASAPLPALPKTDETHMLQFLRILSTMPRSKADAVTAELRVETAMRMLGHLPRSVVDWMTDEALRRFNFHPSIKELLDLSTEWTRGDDSVRARIRAQRLAREEHQARLDNARSALRRGDLDQDAIDGLPERMRAILEGEGLLWRCECGSHVARRVIVVAGDPMPGAADPLSRLRERFQSNR